MCWGSVSRKNPVNEETSNLLIRQWEPARWSEAKIKVWGSMDSKVMERANCKTGGEWRMGHCAGKHPKRWIGTKNWMAMDQRQSKRGVKVWCNAASLKAPLLKHTSNFFKCGFALSEPWTAIKTAIGSGQVCARLCQIDEHYLHCRILSQGGAKNSYVNNKQRNKQQPSHKK